MVTTLMQRHKVKVGFLSIPHFEAYGEVCKFVTSGNWQTSSWFMCWIVFQRATFDGLKKKKQY
jgi:hypothetical protein